MNHPYHNPCGMPERGCCHPCDRCMPCPCPCPRPCPPCPPCPAPEPDTFTIVYNPNGGFGGTADFDLISGSVYTIKSPAEADVYRPNFTFISWNTQPDGGGTVYLPGDSITVTQNLVLYAQWETAPPDTVLVIYDPNGGTGGAIDNVPVGISYTIRNPIETNTERPGYVFIGWNTQPNGSGVSYAPGQIITITSDLVLFAQWIQLAYTITYHKNDPVAPDGQQITFGPYESGTAVTVISISQTAFSVPGYVFIGWNTSWDGTGISYTPNMQITIDSNINLYAMWMRRD